MCPLVKVLIFILYPICYPLSKFLDWILGVHEFTTRFEKRDLKALIHLHEDHHEYNLEEIKMIKSIIDVKTIKLKRIIVPLSRTFFVKEN